MSEAVRRTLIFALGAAVGLAAGWLASRTASARMDGAGRLELAVVETFDSLEALVLLDQPDRSALEAQLHRNLEFALATSDLLLERGHRPEEPLDMTHVMNRYAPLLRGRPDLRRKLESVVARLARPRWS